MQCPVHITFTSFVRSNRVRFSFFSVKMFHPDKWKEKRIFPHKICKQSKICGLYLFIGGWIRWGIGRRIAWNSSRNRHQYEWSSRTRWIFAGLCCHKITRFWTPFLIKNNYFFLNIFCLLVWSWISKKENFLCLTIKLHSLSKSH